MSRTHIHFASEPKHLRNDDWVCVLCQARWLLPWVGPGCACLHQRNVQVAMPAVAAAWTFLVAAVPAC